MNCYLCNTELSADKIEYQIFGGEQAYICPICAENNKPIEGYHFAHSCSSHMDEVYVNVEGKWSLAPSTCADRMEPEYAFVEGGWNPMQTAPMDGTPIETKCTYGLMPTYGVAKFNPMLPGFEQISSPGFTAGGRISMRDSSTVWRPLRQPVETYVDPAGGAQANMDNWRALAGRRSK